MRQRTDFFSSPGETLHKFTVSDQNTYSVLKYVGKLGNSKKSKNISYLFKY